MSELGDCYPTAARVAVRAAGGGVGDQVRELVAPFLAVGECEDWHLVHGTVESPTTGVRHGHAWTECETPAGRVCVDVSNGNAVAWPASFYYQVGAVSDVVRYPAADVPRLLVRYGHFGPWG